MNNSRSIFSKITLAGMLTLPLGVAIAEEKKVELSEVPAAVKATIEANSQGSKIEEIELESEGGKQIYSVELKSTDGKERELEIAADGKLLKTESADDDDDATEKDDDAKEAKIDPSTAPEAVRSALTPLLGGAAITAMTKETDDGKAVYEAEYTENGMENSIEVSEDGKVLEIEKAVSIDSLSAEVKNAAKEKFPNGTIKTAERVEKKSDAKPASYLELKIQDAGKIHELKVDAAGKVISVEEDD